MPETARLHGKIVGNTLVRGERRWTVQVNDTSNRTWNDRACEVRSVRPNVILMRGMRVIFSLHFVEVERSHDCPDGQLFLASEVQCASIDDAIAARDTLRFRNWDEIEHLPDALLRMSIATTKDEAVLDLYRDRFPECFSSEKCSITRRFRDEVTAFHGQPGDEISDRALANAELMRSIQDMTDDFLREQRCSVGAR